MLCDKRILLTDVFVLGEGQGAGGAVEAVAEGVAGPSLNQVQDPSHGPSKLIL